MVRYTSTYILFLVYIISSFGRVIPVVNDFISHTFAEAIHIAIVHAKYGSNHLGMELEKADRNSGKSKTARTSENMYILA